MNKTVIIPHYKEPLLKFTVENVRRTAPGAEIITMDDRNHEGVGQMRHRGIMQASGDVVAIIDAHMDFSDGWLDKMAELAVDSQNVVGCECRGLDPDTLKYTERRNYGARWVETDGDKAFLSRWHNKQDETIAEVQVCLGACYVFDRNWYIDGLAAPWQWQVGWGKSEQMLCMTNCYLGGCNIVTKDAWGAHLFRKERPRTAPHHDRRNAFYVYHALIDEEARQRVNKAWGISPAPTYGRKELDCIGAIEKTQAHLDKYAVRNYGDFLKVP